MIHTIMYKINFYIKMRLLIASDHRGFEFKQDLIRNLNKDNFRVVDLGTDSKEMVDYPDFAHKLCQNLQINDIGVLICGSGTGMSIAANRHKNVRAALCKTIKDATLARQHNNANVVVLGSDNTSSSRGLRIVLKFIRTKFKGGRYQRRIDKLKL